jgi:cyclophilin family peptidyl-prolyl cis-trans isomerase
MHRSVVSRWLSKAALIVCAVCLFSSLAARLYAVDWTLFTTNVTMPAGRTFQMPLTASDPMGSPLTFSLVSISTTNVTGTIASTNNRSLLLDVSGVDATNGAFNGDLVLQLYEDLTPLTTARIIQLAKSGFYNGLTFHRVIQDFMCQGGDPLGNGTGGTGIKFDDEFVASLTFSGFGQLAMANSGDDSNDSQFFITDSDLSLADPMRQPTSWLNFNHTIFGQLTRGFDVHQKILATPVSGSTPITPVVINSASVFTNKQEAVLRLSAAQGFAGTANVTVNVMNTNGQSASTTIQVTVVANTVNSPPFLGPIPANLITTQNIAKTFELTVTDVDNDPTNLSLTDATNPNQFPTGLSNFTYNSGVLTLIPNLNFIGEINMILGVKDNAHDDSDTQHFSLTVVPVCTYTLGSAGKTFTSDGGTGSVPVTAGIACDWTATETIEWVHITSGSNGPGNGAVQYTVSANDTTNARSGNLHIAGKLYTINQAGAGCSLLLGTTATNHTAAAVVGSFPVTVSFGCPWVATTTDTWIHTTSSSSGNGAVNYFVEANLDFAPRAGTITVEGQTFTVMQDGAMCSYSIAPMEIAVGAGGTNASVDVAAAGTNCEWTALSNDSWITILSGTNGTGSGTVDYSVASNPATSNRVGTVIIAGRTFTVTQASNTVDQTGVVGDWDVTLASTLKISKVLTDERSSDGQGLLQPDASFELIEEQYGPTPISSGTWATDAKGRSLLLVLTPDGQEQLRQFLLAWLAEAADTNDITIENADLTIVKLKVGKTKILTGGALGPTKINASGSFTGILGGEAHSGKFSCSIVVTWVQKNPL